MMVSMTLCLGNGPLKLTRLMGPWPRDNSRCLQGDPGAPRVSWSDLAAPRTDWEGGRGRGQVVGGTAVAGDELRAAAGDAGTLFQLHQRLRLSKPRFPHLQSRGDPSIKRCAFLFLMPASIYLGLPRWCKW